MLGGCTEREQRWSPGSMLSCPGQKNSLVPKQTVWCSLTGAVVPNQLPRPLPSRSSHTPLPPGQRKVLGHAVGADGLNTRQRLGEVGVDGGAGHRIQPLQLNVGAAVVLRVGREAGGGGLSMWAGRPRAEDRVISHSTHPGCTTSKPCRSATTLAHYDKNSPSAGSSRRRPAGRCPPKSTAAAREGGRSSARRLSCVCTPCARCTHPLTHRLAA